MSSSAISGHDARSWRRRAARLSWCACLLLVACAREQGSLQGLNEADAGGLTPCDALEACARASGKLPGPVCRAGVCRDDVLCFDDVECGLGESCVEGRCAFTSCFEGAHCPSGVCRAEVFACAECGEDAHCAQNPDRKACDVATGRCVQCRADADCSEHGAPYCDLINSTCVHCQTDAHCYTGLSCQAGQCRGAPKGAVCSQDVACDIGLLCVSTSATLSTCQTACSLYRPTCAPGEICLKVGGGAGSSAIIFEGGEPLGICFPPLQGRKDVGQGCVRFADGHDCQPHLECVPDSATTAVCRAYCDPTAPACGGSEKCHRFPGDYSGREVGLCFPDNGYGRPCARDADCNAGQSCQARVDPTAPSGVSLSCQFSRGAAPALSPCGAALRDAGVDPQTSCATGACVGLAPKTKGEPFYCYGACASDADCQVDGREGVCDGQFTLSTPSGTSAALRGCRPRCDAADPQACALYGPGVACRPVGLSDGGTASVCERVLDGGAG